ncbi:MAG: type II toxin-antitoxin system Phd/YefM family antitoxin [Chloroflexi bacterium]|nr:type II toxin-antitoxin system Phd/YefM family antitoxin [Chloroflexota bacterium]
MTTKIMPATDLRAQIGNVLDELVETGEPVFVTRHGRAQAVLINVTAYDTLIQRTAPPTQIVREPLAQYRAVLESVDFSERGDAADRDQHAQEVNDELAEVRRRATNARLARE